jgi:transposase
MVPNTAVRYSLSFKHQVINELESGRFGSINEARVHYGIKGWMTVIYWLRKYGKNHLCPKVVRVEKPNEQSELRQMKQRIRQLEEALGKTQAENVLNQEFLKIACRQMGQDVDQFKKKADMTQSIRPIRKELSK